MIQIRRAVKYSLATIGLRCSSRTMFALDAAINHLAVGAWMKRHNVRPGQTFASRRLLFEWIAETIKLSDVLYLEFGVAEGKSMELWSKLLVNRNSQLYGFDSFEGLPEAWEQWYQKGRFSTGGVAPPTNDSRVTYVKGWFDETLPMFIPPRHEVLFINVDADLYSSARTVLRHMRPYVEVGTYLYFDEFHHRYDEMKAYDEFVAQTGYKFEMLAADKTFNQVLFRRLG